MASSSNRYFVVSHKWKQGFQTYELQPNEDPDQYMKKLAITHSSVMFKNSAGTQNWMLYKTKGKGKINDILEKQQLYLPEIKAEKKHEDSVVVTGSNKGIGFEIA